MFVMPVPWYFQIRKETPAYTEKNRDLKGLGHKIESKYFL